MLFRTLRREYLITPRLQNFDISRKKNANLKWIERIKIFIRQFYKRKFLMKDKIPKHVQELLINNFLAGW